MVGSKSAPKKSPALQGKVWGFTMKTLLSIHPLLRKTFSAQQITELSRCVKV